MSKRRSRVTFTTRGSSLIAAGIATGVGAVVLGETDLLRIAVAVVVLCVLIVQSPRFVSSIKGIRGHDKT